MDFYASKDEPLRPNVSLADMIGEDVNRSFNSAISAASSGSAGPSSSSKAVLAALRALQDKIRRLETERSQALDEASQLRLQLKNQEIEHEHAKQREQLATQKSLQEAKTSLERTQHEKSDLEERLHSLEGRNRSLQQSSEELQVRIRKLEEDKQHGNGRLRDLENQHSVLEQQIRLAQQREKDAAETILWETRKHDEELSSLHMRVRHLQVEVSEASREKGELDARVIELDQLVAQLLSLNESLVAQLSGRPFKANIFPSPSLSSTGKKKKKKVVEKAPRAASLSTAAADASKTSKFTTRASSQLIPVKSNDVEQLKAMHKLYSSMAKSLRKPSPVKSRKSAASHDDSKVQTRMKTKKSSSIHTSLDDSNVQYPAASTPSGLNYSTHSTNGSVSKREVRIPKANVTFDTEVDSSQAHDYTYLSDHHARESSPQRASHPDVSISGYYSETSTSSNAKELQSVISSLEEEFDTLNRQYRRLLTNVQASNSVVEGNNHDILTSDGIQAQAEEIVNVIQKLHQRGEQIRMLKSPTR